MLSLQRASLFSFIILNIFFFACSNKKQQQQERKRDPPPVVDVIIAKTTTISNILEANGTVIASVNDADLRAQLNKSKAQLQLYQQNEERLRKLLDINGVNQADYDAALNLVNS